MTVECARCGRKYENPRVSSQMDADGKLEVCDPCDQEIYDETHDELRLPRGGPGVWIGRYYRFGAYFADDYDTLRAAVGALASGMDAGAMAADSIVGPDGSSLEGREMDAARWAWLESLESPDFHAFDRWIAENKPEWVEYLDDRP
jgi:hypothetical protein